MYISKVSILCLLLQLVLHSTRCRCALKIYPDSLVGHFKCIQVVSKSARILLFWSFKRKTGKGRTFWGFSAAKSCARKHFCALFKNMLYGANKTISNNQIFYTIFCRSKMVCIGYCNTCIKANIIYLHYTVYSYYIPLVMTEAITFLDLSKYSSVPVGGGGGESKFVENEGCYSQS